MTRGEGGGVALILRCGKSSGRNRRVAFVVLRGGVGWVYPSPPLAAFPGLAALSKIPGLAALSKIPGIYIPHLPGPGQRGRIGRAGLRRDGPGRPRNINNS